jgi:hypothetical protein
MMSLPSASGELFSSFIVWLHTMQLTRSISGLRLLWRAIAFDFKACRFTPAGLRDFLTNFGTLWVVLRFG